MANDEKKAYSKGYNAGRRYVLRKQREEKIKNERATMIAAHMMEAAMRGKWGVTTSDGKRRTYNLLEIEDMVVASVSRLVGRMKVH